MRTYIKYECTHAAYVFLEFQESPITTRVPVLVL